MTTKEKMNSLKKTARIAGVLSLIISVFAPFSMMYIPSNLIVPGDAATTANNIMASEGLFRIGIVSDSVVFLLEIVLVFASLYYLIQSFGNFLLPQYQEIFAWVGLSSTIELAFVLWLVIKGVRDQQPATTEAG